MSDAMMRAVRIHAHGGPEAMIEDRITIPVPAPLGGSMRIGGLLFPTYRIFIVGIALYSVGRIGTIIQVSRGVLARRARAGRKARRARTGPPVGQADSPSEISVEAFGRAFRPWSPTSLRSPNLS